MDQVTKAALMQNDCLQNHPYKTVESGQIT